MRNRWSLFIAGLILFLTWYVVVYVGTSGTLNGLPTGAAYGLAAVICGLTLGAMIGVSIHALDLHRVHREALAGDARDGARVSLGKLPPIVPVTRKSDDASDRTPLEPAGDPEPEILPPVGRKIDHAGGHAPAEPDAVTPLPEPAASAPEISIPDRLALECARFVVAHESAVAVADAGNSATIDRVANLAEFGEFVALVRALENEGVDVSRVAVSPGSDDLPAAVTFPIFRN